MAGSNDNDEMTPKSLKEILEEFEVKNEQELYDTLNGRWKIAECIFCGAEVDLMHCGWSNGDPCCKNGCL